MILASQTLLVEGPSDELVVQKAFLPTHGRLPLEAGVEVISVNLPFALPKLIGAPRVIQPRGNKRFVAEDRQTGRASGGCRGDF